MRAEGPHIEIDSSPSSIDDRIKKDQVFYRRERAHRETSSFINQQANGKKKKQEAKKELVKKNKKRSRKAQRKKNHLERDLSLFIDQQINELKESTNKDGIHGVKDLAAKTFEEFDIDGDGEISMEEFRLLIGEKRALMSIAESNRPNQLHVNKLLRTKLESDPNAIERDQHLRRIFAERADLKSDLQKATEELSNAESKLRLLQRQINYKKEEVQNELLLRSMERQHEKRVTAIM